MSTYKDHEITETHTTTDTRHGIRHVFEISGPFRKPAGRRPFLTSVAACKRYINECRDIESERAYAELIEAE